MREFKADRGEGPTFDKLYVDRLSLAAIHARPNNQSRPISICAEQRFIFLSELGTPLTAARFKHRGITDTKGKKADKKEASGHKSETMAMGLFLPSARFGGFPQD